MSIQLKEKARKRDDQQCRFCGMTREEHLEEHNEQLHVHHIIRDSEGGMDRLENYMTVCVECHRLLEKTQADAISRIKSDHLEEAQQRISELESRVDHLMEERDAERSAKEELIDAVVEFARHRVTIGVYVVHESKFVTSELRYVGLDSDVAYEKFQACGGAATLETSNIRIDGREVVDEYLATESGELAEELEGRLQ